jgi:hypothetical protein
MAEIQKIGNEEIINHLFAEDDDVNNLVVLFDDSMQLREVNRQIETALKDNPHFRFDMNVAFKITDKVIQFDKKKVFLALDKDESCLAEHTLTHQLKKYGNKLDEKR